MGLMPVVFFGHGSPTNAIEDNHYTQNWVKMCSDIFKPSAIVSVSAHWETNGTKITSNQKQLTIHDFYGFSKELHNVYYNCDGDQNLADQICKVLPEVKQDLLWGLDHGTWSVLRHIYPSANVPVLQLSIDTNKTPEEHYTFAKSLSWLRNEGVLVIASGNIVHNLREINWQNTKPHSWAVNFASCIKNLLLNDNHSAIINYKSIADWHKSVPTPEHFLPLLYIIALQSKGEKAVIFNDNIDLSSIDMTCLRFG